MTVEFSICWTIWLDTLFTRNRPIFLLCSHGTFKSSYFQTKQVLTRLINPCSQYLFAIFLSFFQLSNHAPMQKFSRSLAVHTFRPHRSKIWPRFSRSYFRTNFRPVENVPYVNKAWDTNNEKQEYKGGFLVKPNLVYLLEFSAEAELCASRVFTRLKFFLFSKRHIPTAYFAAWTFIIVSAEVGFVILLAFTSVPAATCRRSIRAINGNTCSISSTNSVILNNSSWNKRQILGESPFYEFISFYPLQFSAVVPS